MSSGKADLPIDAEGNPLLYRQRSFVTHFARIGSVSEQRTGHRVIFDFFRGLGVKSAMKSIGPGELEVRQSTRSGEKGSEECKSGRHCVTNKD